MDKKLKIVMFTAIIVVLVVIVVFSVGNNAPAVNTQNTNSTFTNTTTLNQTGTNSSKMISLTELSKHNSETDCWVVYQGKVYDLTSWLPKHPGSAEAIMPYCGNQGFEEAFKKQHGSSKASLFIQVAKLIGDIEFKGSI